MTPGITYFNRDRRTGNYSMEELFANIRKGLPDDWVQHDYEYNAHKGLIKSLRELKQYETDINHITGDVNFLAYGLSPEKTILTVHDIGHYERTLKGWKKIVYKQFWLNGPFRRVHYLTTISEFTKSRMIYHFGIRPDKIKVIPNPYPKLFSQTPKTFDQDCPKILQVGGGHNKNINRLLEAIKDLKCELILIRPEDSLLKQKIESYGIRYRWFSNLSYEDVAQQYSASDLIFFASEYEGFGMPILEGNASGTPVLTGSNSAMPETAGNAACLVDSFSVQDIRKGILKIIENEGYRQELIENGYENIKRFELQQTAALYLQVYQDVLSR